MSLWWHAQPQWLLHLFFALTGAVAGSFINVVIYRVSLMIAQENNLRYNLFLPRSHCPACCQTLNWYHTLPILSWLLLKGRCGWCSKKISIRYLLVELFFTLLALLLSYLKQDLTEAFFSLLFCGFLLPLTLIDLRTKMLPDMLTLPFLWAGLLFHALAPASFPTLADAVYGAVAGYVALWLLYWLFYGITGREGLGYGDFKLLAALGAWFGWAMLPGILLLAASLGLIAAVFARLVSNKKLTREIPFGPFLAAAGLAFYFSPF